jgi:hypothetical protein
MTHRLPFSRSWHSCALIWLSALHLLSGCAHNPPVPAPPQRPLDLLTPDLQREPPPPGAFMRALECLSQQAETSAPRFNLCLLDVSN